MSTFSIPAVLAAATLACAGVFGFAESNVTSAKAAACGCVDCQCPDCTGVCSCETCLCGSCGCATTAAKAAPVAKSCCAKTAACVQQ